MSRAEANFLHVGVATLGLTGLVYGWMKYFVEPADEFSIVGHPWQPTFQHAHVLLAPLLVFGCGLVWRAHVWAKLRSGTAARRATGIALATLLAPAILSGYALQVCAQESWRGFWIWTHVATSLAWLLLYLWHQSRPRAST